MFFPPICYLFCEWHEMYEPPIRFVSVLNFRLVYFSIYNWKINLGCNFSCCDIALQKNSKMLCWWMPTHQNYANPPGKKKLRRMFDINKTHVVATTVSMMIHDTTGYKCKQCEKPRVPIHLVGTIEVCLIKQSVVENAISVYMRNPVKHLIILFCSHIILLIWYVKLAWHLCLILQWHPLNLYKTKRWKKESFCEKKNPTICPQGSISSSRSR